MRSYWELKKREKVKKTKTDLNPVKLSFLPMDRECN